MCTQRIMTDAELEREQVECVFHLGGGELYDEPWKTREQEWAYWYEGAPEYARRECGDSCRTVIGEFLFSAAPDYLTEDDGSLWTRVALYQGSGEAECWWCGPGTGNEDKREDCKLCEGGGFCYLGECWCEVVYRSITCASCEQGPASCDCEDEPESD